MTLQGMPATPVRIVITFVKEVMLHLVTSPGEYAAVFQSMSVLRQRW